MKSTHKIINDKLNGFSIKYLPIIVFSALTGALSGLVVVCYNFIAEYLTKSSQSLYRIVYEHPVFIPLVFLSLFILAFLSYVILKHTPEAMGSGIPHNGTHQPKCWLRSLLSTIFASFISFFGGLSLGTEGSSTAIGASLGAGISKIKLFKKQDSEELAKTVTSSGASAGLVAAFSTPLSGIVYALEELLTDFNPLLLVSASTSIFTSLLTSTVLRNCLKLQPLRIAQGTLPIPIEYVWTPLLLGIICALFIMFFKKALSYIGQLKFVIRLPLFVKLLMVFFLTGVAGLFLTDALGGGAFLVAKLNSDTSFRWETLLALLLIKTLLTVLAASSTASGGLLFPSLTLGALLGAILGKLFIALGVPSTYYHTFIILGIGACLATTFRLPFTAIVLVLETSNSPLTDAPGLIIAVLTAVIVSELFHQKSIFEAFDGAKLEL